MALTGWFRNSAAARVLSDTAQASLDTLRQTTKSNPGSGIPPGTRVNRVQASHAALSSATHRRCLAAMALASAALLGIVSTFSWANVLNAGKLKGEELLNLHKLLLCTPSTHVTSGP